MIAVRPHAFQAPQFRVVKQIEIVGEQCVYFGDGAVIHSLRMAKARRADAIDPRFVAVVFCDSVRLEPKPVDQSLKVFLESLHAAHEVDEWLATEMRPIAGGVEGQAQVAADIPHLIFAEQIDPGVEIVIGPLESLLVFLHLPEDEFFDPRLRVGAKRLVLNVTLHLEKSCVGAVIGIADKRRRAIAAAGLGQAPKIRTDEMLMDDPTQTRVETINVVVRAFLEDGEPGPSGLARRLPRAEQDELLPCETIMRSCTLPIAPGKILDRSLCTIQP